MFRVSSQVQVSMTTYDISASRAYLRERFPKANFDSRHVFYYDETNNPRKFYVKESEFSTSFRSNFVLGGLVFENPETNLDGLFSGLKLQGNIQDVKLKHLTHGKFSECLDSQKLNYFLEYLLDKKIPVHFQWVNLLYWSTADIVDSCIANSEVAMKVADEMHEKVKDDFYRLTKGKVDEFIDLFYRYRYPNVDKENVIPFLTELESLFYPEILQEELHFGLEALRQILGESKKKKKLPFLTNEKDYMLMREFGEFYIDPVGIFKNSQHIFDNEATVQNKMSKLKIMDGDQEIRNYSFVDSADHRPIQASDIYVGMMGKFSTFLNSSSHEEIVSEMNAWSKVQRRNSYLLIRIMNYSAEINPGFIHSIDSHWERDKVSVISEILDAW